MSNDLRNRVARARRNLGHGDEFTAADLRAILDDHARLTAALAEMGEPAPAKMQPCASVSPDHAWEPAEPAPVSVREAARLLAEKLEAPFEHADMNAEDIDWQKVWADFWQEASEMDAPAAILRALRAIAEGKDDE